MVFERICRNAGYQTQRPVLRDREEVPTADFVVTTSGFRLAAEVETFGPNKDDLQRIDSTRRGRMPKYKFHDWSEIQATHPACGAPIKTIFGSRNSFV